MQQITGQNCHHVAQEAGEGSICGLAHDHQEHIQGFDGKERLGSTMGAGGGAQRGSEHTGIF